MEKGETENYQDRSTITRHNIACQSNNGTFYFRVILQTTKVRRKNIEHIIIIIFIFISLVQPALASVGFQFSKYYYNRLQQYTSYIFDTLNTTHTNLTRIVLTSLFVSVSMVSKYKFSRRTA